MPVANLLGERGAGFVIAQERLGPGRIHHCMRWIGICERAFDLICDRAVARELSPGRPLGPRAPSSSGSPRAGRRSTRARLLVLHAAWRIERDGADAAREEISIIKFVVAGTLHRVLDRAIQAHGALGMTDDTPLACWFRARAGRAHLRRPRRGAQGVGGAAHPAGARSAGPARRGVRWSTRTPPGPGEARRGARPRRAPPASSTACAPEVAGAGGRWSSSRRGTRTSPTCWGWATPSSCCGGRRSAPSVKTAHDMGREYTVLSRAPARRGRRSPGPCSSSPRRSPRWARRST